MVAKTKKKSSSRTRKASSRKKKRKTARKEIRIGIWTITAILAGLSIFLSWPFLSKRHAGEKGAALPDGEYVYGMDISHFQTDIQWDSLMILSGKDRKTIKSPKHAKDIRPVSFVFIKATEGNSMKDKRFSKHWKEAGESNIRRGAYHFFRSSKDPGQQARNFIRAVGKLRYKDLPPVLDIETIHSGCSRKTLNVKALEWLKIIEKHYGRKPIVYSSSSFIEDVLCDEIKENYPIWVAHYDVDTPRYKDWDFWQFTDKALVHGVEGHVDLNVCSTETFRNMQ